MRKVRCLYFLMSLFSLISLICIGFSSWTISGTGAEVMGTGGITASPVYDVDEYATCTSVECFEYYSSGFLKNSVDSSYGSVTAYYDLNNTEQLKSSGKKISVYMRAHYADLTSILFNTRNGPLAYLGCHIKAKKASGDYVSLGAVYHYIDGGEQRFPNATYFGFNSVTFTHEDIASSNSFINGGSTVVIVLPEAVFDYSTVAVEYVFTYISTSVFGSTGTCLQNSERKAEFFAHARIS